MIAVHWFETSREAIQWMWSGPAHARRQAPDASLTELFIHLHGMLLTKIQLDDFKPMLARFEEKLHIEGECAVGFFICECSASVPVIADGQGTALWRSGR